MLACKHEEVLPALPAAQLTLQPEIPDLSEFVYVCADTYSEAEIIETERNVLATLNYRVRVQLYNDVLFYHHALRNCITPYPYPIPL